MNDILLTSSRGDSADGSAWSLFWDMVFEVSAEFPSAKTPGGAGPAVKVFVTSTRFPPRKSPPAYF